MNKKKINSTNQINKSYLDDVCMSSYAIGIIGNRWKLSIFYHIKEQPMRFSELKKSISGITERMLALNLNEMERDNLIIKKVYPEVPVKVVYELSDLGVEFIVVWNQLDIWGRKHKDSME